MASIRITEGAPISRRSLLYIAASVMALPATVGAAMAAPNISTKRMAPVGTDPSLGLAMGDAVVPPAARAVQLTPLGTLEYWHFGWTLEWVRADAGLDVYHIKNDDMGLYLTMSDGDGLHSRILGGVLSGDPNLIPTQEWRVKPWGDKQFQFLTANRFAMQTYTDVHGVAQVWLERADIANGSNQIWQV